MRLVWALLAIWAGVMMWGAVLMLDNSRIIEMTRYEIQYLREQQDANARDIRHLIDEQWDLKERIKQVMRDAWR